MESATERGKLIEPVHESLPTAQRLYQFDWLLGKPVLRPLSIGLFYDFWSELLFGIR